MAHEPGFSSFIKELAQKHIVGRELSSEAKAQLWDALTDQEKQRYRSLEDAPSKNQTDKALLDSIIDQAKKTTDQGYKTLELFPKKGYENYVMILDGHRLYCNTRHPLTITYRCKYHSSGCFAKCKVSNGTMRTVNTHQNHPAEFENYHYRCPYAGCPTKPFSDLRLRKEHILETQHKGGHGAPWPMDPARCIFAEYDGIEQGESALTVTLNHQPSLNAQIERLQIIQRNLIITTTEAETRQHQLFLQSYKEEEGTKAVKDEKSKKRPPDTIEDKRKSEQSKAKSSNKELRNLHHTGQQQEYYCEVCDVAFSTSRRKADHEFSNRHKENLKVSREQELDNRTSLTYDKPIFTEDFLQYNKALETELRSLRKGAVELEEQNAVLGTHIESLRGVVEELEQGRDRIENEKQRLHDHLEDLYSELSRVFKSLALPKNSVITERNLERWFSELVLIMKSRGNNGIKERIKKGLKSIEVDTVML